MTKIYCTLDTETLGGAAKPEGIYDLGGLIHDRKGNILASFHYIVAEHYSNIDGAFYGKQNFERYQDMIASGTATMIPTEDAAIAAVNALCDLFSVTTVMAFNSGFDLTKTACRELLDGREFIDLYLMALQCLVIRKKYAAFCEAHELYSKSKKSLSTNAEAVFAYLTNNPDYEEEHTAFADAAIEKQIFDACVRAHKAFTPNVHFHDFDGKWGLIPKR